MLFDFHRKRKSPRRHRRRAPYEPPRPGVTRRPSGLMLSDPDYHRERREAEAEAAGFEAELAEIISALPEA